MTFGMKSNFFEKKGEAVKNENLSASVNEQFGDDPEIIAELAEAEKQKNIFDGISAANILEALNNPERKAKFTEHLNNLQGKLEKLGKYWPVLAGAATTIAILITSFAMDAGTPENSKIDASEILAALSVPFAFITTIMYMNKTEKGSNA